MPTKRLTETQRSENWETEDCLDWHGQSKMGEWLVLSILREARSHWKTIFAKTLPFFCFTFSDKIQCTSSIAFWLGHSVKVKPAF